MSLLAALRRPSTNAATRVATPSMAVLKFWRCRSVIRLISSGTGRKRSATQRSFPSAPEYRSFLNFSISARAPDFMASSAAFMPRSNIDMASGSRVFSFALTAASVSVKIFSMLVVTSLRLSSSFFLAETCPDLTSPVDFVRTDES